MAVDVAFDFMNHLCCSSLCISYFINDCRNCCEQIFHADLWFSWWEDLFVVHVHEIAGNESKHSIGCFWWSFTLIVFPTLFIKYFAFSSEFPVSFKDKKQQPATFHLVYSSYPEFSLLNFYTKHEFEGVYLYLYFFSDNNTIVVCLKLKWV